MLKIRKKRALTLLEIMIVIFLIGIISSVIGYNVKGSLDKGRAFKSARAIQQVHDILELMVADGYSVEEVTKDPVKYLNLSGLVRNGDESIKDGWGQRLQVSEGRGRIFVSSERYNRYKQSHPRPSASPPEQQPIPEELEAEE